MVTWINCSNFSGSAKNTMNTFTGMWILNQKQMCFGAFFWCHASQRAEYKDFGDVVTFDTTHKTNNKHMPLAMFVGCSNNLKNVSFGQALLRDETIDTFRWLFETFKSCMGGQQPFVILTGMLWLQKNACHIITAVLLQLYL